jgi:predicted RNA-binding protein YlqC (UPF0109 family)
MANSIDQQFIEYIVKSLVGKPDDVKIKRTIDEKGVLLELSVDPEDLGRVIGKRGATAQSLRTLLRALGTKNDARYNLKIVDTGPAPAPRRGEREEEKPQADTSVSSETPPEEPEDTGDDIVTPDEEAADHSSVISKTREELAELDDLDV